MERPKTLSAAFVKTITRPGRYGDGRGGHGLSLLVVPMSSNTRLSKTWSQRLRIAGKPVNVGIGSYPVTTLAAARAKALENARAVADGIDPRVKPSRIPTFAVAAELVIEEHTPVWRSGGRQADIWRSSLERHVYPVLKDIPIDKITTADIRACLVPIWATKPETAKRLKGYVSTIMRWAIGQGHRSDDPAGVALTASLPKVSKVQEHQRALPFTEVGAAIATIRDSSAWPSTKLAFEFLTLTAARSGEVRQAQWREIDGDVWTIPGDRMKTGREHRTPLSRQAMDVLRQARELSDGSGLVFPSQRGKALTDSTVSKMVRENGVGCVPHGMRSSFRDWAAECSDAPREIAEHCLAHVEGSASELAYRRTDYFERRRILMEQWSDFISS